MYVNKKIKKKSPDANLLSKREELWIAAASRRFIRRNVWVVPKRGHICAIRIQIAAALSIGCISNAGWHKQIPRKHSRFEL